MNKIIATALIALMIVGVGLFLLRGNNQAQQQMSLGVSAPENENIEDTMVNSANTDDETIIGPEGQSEAREIDIVSDNFIYDPKFIEVEKGETIVINFQNIGIHTFTIDELGINESLRGNSVTVEFTPGESGTFEFYCAIPGHKELGMIGELIIN